MAGFYGLIGFVWLIAQGVEDQTGLGWVWVLLFITVPAGSVLGGVLGNLVTNRLIKSSSEDKVVRSNDI